MAASPSERFTVHAARTGQRVTAQKLRVVESVWTLAGPFDQEDVVSALVGQVSRATVFRTLAQLLEAEMLRRVRFNDRDVFVVTAASE